MGEELIDRIADRAKLSGDKEFIVEALTEIYTNFEKISNLKIKLSGDSSFKDAVNTVKQLKTVQDELDASQRKLAQSTTDYNKQIQANKLATQQNNQAAKEQAQLSQASEGSIKQKVILLKQLTAQYDALSAAARKSEHGEGLLKDIKSLSKETTHLKEETGRSQDNVGNYFEKGKESLKEFGAELLTQAALFIGITQAFDFLKESVKEFQHAQQEASKLNNILTNIGRKDVFARLNEEAENLAKEFGTIKSEDLVGVFDQLVVYGKLTENQIKELTPVIINFAAQTGKSLEESTSLLLKGLEGNGRALKEFGINMKDGKDSAERFGIIMSELAPKVEGAAKAFGETTAGQIKKTEVEIDELKKKVGEDLQPVQRGFLQFLASGLEGIPQILETIGNKITEVKESFIDAFVSIQALATGNASLIDIRNAEKAVAAGRIAEAKEWVEINEHAKLVSEEAAKSSLKEQEVLLKQNISLRDHSDQLYLGLVKDGKKDTEEGHKAFLQLATDQQVVANLYEVIARSKDKSILGSGDPDAGGEKQKRESLIAEIKAEAEARLKLLELREQERLAAVRINIESPGGTTISRINAAKEAGEIEQEIIQEKLKVELQANDLERQDLKETYEFNLKNKKTTEAEKAFLTQKYYLQEKTFEENRQLIIEKADEEIYKKKVEYNILVIKLHAESLNQELADEAFTVKELTAQREAYYKAREEQTKLISSRTQNYNNEARDILLASLEERFSKALIKEKEYNDEKKKITADALKFSLKAQLQELEEQRTALAGRNLELPSDKQLDPTKIDAEIAAKKLEIERNKDEKIIATNKEVHDRKIKIQDAEIELAREAANTIAAFVDGAYEGQINHLQDQINANNKLKEAGIQRIATETASETTKAAQLTILAHQTDAQNEALTRKQNQVKQKQAAFDRDKAIFDIASNTAVAIIKAVAEFPATAGEPFAAIAAAIGAVQIAAVLAKPLPHYKGGVGLNGAPGHPGGGAVVGDGGRSELAVLPDGSMIVTPNRPTVMNLPKDTIVYPDADAINRGMMNRMVERTMQMMGIMVQESTASEIRELKEEVRYQTVRIERALGKAGKRPIHIHNEISYKDSEHIRKSVYE